MQSPSSSSLCLAIQQILDKIGSDDSFFPTETPDVSLPGPSTPEFQALESSIRRLVTRFKGLEQNTIHSSPPLPTQDVRPPVTKRLQNVKEEKNGGVCVSCGHRLDIVPLTPEETPPVVDTGEPYVLRGGGASEIPLRLLGLTYFAADGYESSASDTPTVSSVNPPDSVVRLLEYINLL